MTSPMLEVPAPQHDLQLTHKFDDLTDGPLARAVAAAQSTFAFGATQHVAGHHAPADLLPLGATILARHDSPNQNTTWARHDDVGYLLREVGGGTVIQVLAHDYETAVRERDLVVSRCPAVPDDDVRATLWMSTSNGIGRNSRVFSTPAWSELAGNYAKSTRDQVTGLCEGGPPSGTARLLLWHGSPGTGKTSAVLGLLHAWREWCGVEVVADPERMFNDAGYLLEVMTGNSRKAWRVVVCEDADEYLRSDARQRSGPGLGRLLNASDGLIGRGSRCLLLLTTNDDLGRLHPAVTRPGRCLSLVEFGLLDSAAAGAWLGRPVSRAMTLAELYEARDGGTILSVPPLPIGTYL